MMTDAIATEKVRPPFPRQQQDLPGSTRKMHPLPDHGEKSYVGSGRLKGKRAIVTGGDSGIGRAVAIAFAREGADVLISYLSEEEDAKDTANWIAKTQQKSILFAGDISDPDHCRHMIDRAVIEWGGIDILVNNAAHQMSFDKLQDISDREWERTFDAVFMIEPPSDMCGDAALLR